MTGPATEKALSPQISSSYVEQSSWCRLSSGADTVPDYCCCRGVQNLSGRLDTDVCGLWTSPVIAWTWFGTPLATSVTPSGHHCTCREIYSEIQVTVGLFSVHTEQTNSSASESTNQWSCCESNHFQVTIVYPLWQKWRGWRWPRTPRRRSSSIPVTRANISLTCSPWSR